MTDERTGGIAGIVHVAADFGKVAAVERVRLEQALPRDQVVYVGDGQSHKIVGFDTARIRELFEDQGLVIHEWDRVRTDWLTIREGAEPAPL